MVVGGGGGSKYYGHYKMTPPPPQLQNTRCYLASPVSTFEWFFISFYFHAFNTKTLWLMKEAVVVVVGGGVSRYYGHYKMTPPLTAEYKMLPR